MPKKSSDTFESNLQELESLVKRLEKGELSLDESLKQFEQGINLAQKCQTMLKTAEQKIEVLSKKAENAKPEPFDKDTPDDSI